MAHGQAYVFYFVLQSKRLKPAPGAAAAQGKLRKLIACPLIPHTLDVLQGAAREFLLKEFCSGSVPHSGRTGRSKPLLNRPPSRPYNDRNERGCPRRRAVCRLELCWLIKDDSKMKTFNPVLVPGLILAWLVSSPGNAKEPDLAVDSVLAKWLVGSPGNAKEPLPAVDSVLAKWEEASRKCKTLDAKLTVFRYDGIFGDGRQPTITQGRFYYEAPNLGRYEIRKRKTARGAPNDWSNLAGVIIWTGKETLWIDGDTLRCQKFSTEELRSVTNQPERENYGWFFGIFANIGRQLALILQGPQQCCLLLVAVRAAEVRERFDVTIDKSGEDIRLKAIPKRPADKTRFREIDVILSRKTYMAVATQVVSPSGRERVVHQLSEPEVNQRPSDRDQLIAPDLSGLYVTESHWPTLMPLVVARPVEHGKLIGD